MPKINVKKFSRSNIEREEPPISTYTDYNNSDDVGVDPDNVAPDDTDDLDVDDFLQELSKDVFISQTELDKKEKERIKQEKEDEKQQKKQARLESQQQKLENQMKKQSDVKLKTIKKVQQEEEDKLFSEKGSEIYGRDRLQLIAKINQYKILFP